MWEGFGDLPCSRTVYSHQCLSRTWRVGKALDVLAAFARLKNDNNSVAAPTQRLHLFTMSGQALPFQESLETVARTYAPAGSLLVLEYGSVLADQTREQLLEVFGTRCLSCTHLPWHSGRMKC
eukprot:TRINITY_DN1071_c0_g2_i2.p4 TRINITY_DN1071_c0_g2~~TRINITY_DN1071_c0_g2_i2.p4  ORF type:complete len:123 (-),score=13.90 TRINITY_DN1071_c0_g2_i2:577-945(-)